MIRITRLVPLLWILAAACVADSRAGSTLVLDSAGVRIVVSQVGSWGPDEAWTVDSQPRIQLGLRDRESEQFLGVRRVRLRSDESVVVLDGSSAEIRIFDPAGTLISVLGGEGDGPGELRGPRELHVVAADTILAWDNRPSVTRLAPDGSFVSRQAIDVARLRAFMPDGQTIGVRGLSDGSMLVVGYARPLREVTGRVRNRMLYGRGQIDGRAVDTLGWSLDREWWVTNSDAGSGRTLLGPESFWTAGGMPLRVGVAESEVHDVGPDWIAGVTRTDLGVEVVQVHDLRRRDGK